MKPIIHRSTRAIALLAISQAIVSIAAFFTQIILTRTLAIVEYGALTAAMSIVMFFAPVAGFGVGPFLLWRFGKEGWHGERWIRPSLLVTIISVVLSILGAVSYALIETDQLVRRIVVWLLPLLLAQGLLNYSLAGCQLQAKYGQFAFYQAFTPVARLVLVVIVSLLGLGVLLVVRGYFIISTSLSLLLLLATVMPMSRGDFELYGAGAKPVLQQGEERKSHGLPNEVLSMQSLKGVLAGAWPFALASVFYFIYTQMSIVFLLWLEGPTSVALFNTAITILFATYLFPTLLYQQFLLPHYFRWYESGSRRLLDVYRLGNGVMLSFGLALGVGIATSAPLVMSFLFGESYEASGYILRLIAICIPIRFLASSIAAVLTSGDLIRRKVWYQGLAVLITMIGNLLLIPYAGVYGSAFTMVLAETFLLIMFLYSVRREVFGKDALRGWNVKWWTLR